MITASRLSQEINSYQAKLQEKPGTAAALNQRNSSLLEIDRLFVCVQEGANAVSILENFGLYFPDTVIRSEAEGTKSRICFLENLYLAIIWLEDKPPSSQTAINFPARVNWQDNHTSPFGIGLSRRQEPDVTTLDSCPISDLRVDKYLAYSQKNQQNAIEPLVFFIPDRLKYASILSCKQQTSQKYLSHPLGVRNITDIKMSVQTGKRRNSNVLDWLQQEKLLKIARTDAPLLEITFDGGVRGEIFDARPTLPIIFRY
ncbi:MAG: hypothetical protein AAFQ80_01715 [Cyanobacteria bacterium J06621_8]